MKGKKTPTYLNQCNLTHYIATLQFAAPHNGRGSTKEEVVPWSVPRLGTKTDVLHREVEVAGRVTGSRVMEDFAMGQLFLSTETYRGRHR